MKPTFQQIRDTEDLRLLAEVQSDPELLRQNSHANAVLRLAQRQNSQALSEYLSFAEKCLTDRTISVRMAFNYLLLKKWVPSRVRNSFTERLKPETDFFTVMSQLDLSEFLPKARNLGRIILDFGVRGMKKILSPADFNRLMDTWPDHLKKPDGED